MTPDHSTKALAVLRGIAGSGDLHEAVAGNLLRLDAERRAAFERVLKLQNVPPLMKIWRRKRSSSRGNRPQRAGLRRVARSGRAADQCGLSFLEQTSVCRPR